MSPFAMAYFVALFEVMRRQPPLTVFRIPYSVEVRLSVSFTLLLLFNGITKREGERVSGEGWLRGAGGMPDFCANNMLQVSFQFQFLFAAKRGKCKGEELDVRHAARGD